MEDERAQVVPEFEKHIDTLVVSKQDRVLLRITVTFEAGNPCARGSCRDRRLSSVPAQDPEEFGVDVDRVPPSSRIVDEAPDLGDIQFRLGDGTLEVHELTIDGPTAVASVEPERPDVTVRFIPFRLADRREGP